MNSNNIYFALIGYLILSSLLYKVNEDVLIFFTAMILLGGIYSMIGSSVSEMLDSRAIAVSKRLDLLTSERQKLLSSLLNRSLLNAHVVERAYIMTVYSSAEILSTQDMHNEHLLIRINSYFEDLASFFMASKVSATESIFINNLIKFAGSINTLSPIFNKDVKN